LSLPSYRVRLFLTVDLIGSTAFKFASRKSKGASEPHPEWVLWFRQFYKQFPEAFYARYKATTSGALEGKDAPQSPKVWKTVGDEILFCCKVSDVQHVACAITAFLQALEEFGKTLEANDLPLDVKGAGWLAAFPAENISIEIFNDSLASTDNQDVLSEEFEAAADLEPNKYDFLGPGIDTGFRISKNAAADRFTASVGLAYHLCDAAHHNLFSGVFEYHGRERFKGVNRDQPYPVVSIGSERNPAKRLLRERERMVKNEDQTSPLALGDFLREFMVQEGIDIPTLQRRPGDPAMAPPSSYETFKVAWGINVEELKKRDRGIDEASEKTEAQSGQGTIPEDVRRFKVRESKFRPAPVTITAEELAKIGARVIAQALKADPNNNGSSS